MTSNWKTTIAAVRFKYLFNGPGRPRKSALATYLSEATARLSDNYDPTEADIDMVIEEATGNAVKPANLAAGIASMQQRIAQLETEKTNQIT